MASDKEYTAEQEVNSLWSRQPILLYVPAGGQTVNAVAFAQITGLITPFPLRTDIPYHVSGSIVYVANQTDAAQSAAFSFAGGSPLGLTNIFAKTEFTVLSTGGTSPIPIFTRGGYPADSGPAYVLNRFNAYDFDLTFQCTTSAQFQAQARSTLNTDNFTIQAGSWMRVEPALP